jgi:hypothetical protein
MSDVAALLSTVLASAPAPPKSTQTSVESPAVEPASRSTRKPVPSGFEIVFPVTV